MQLPEETTRSGRGTPKGGAPGPARMETCEAAPAHRAAAEPPVAGDHAEGEASHSSQNPVMSHTRTVARSSSCDWSTVTTVCLVVVIMTAPG